MHKIGPVPENLRRQDGGVGNMTLAVRGASGLERRRLKRGRFDDDQLPRG